MNTIPTTSTDSRVRNEKRNLFVRIPPEKKDALKLLARESSMTLEAYVAALLEEAVKNEDRFTFTKVAMRS